VIALDAYALVAYLADEPARGEVEEILRKSCLVTTVNLAESLDVLGRVHRITEHELRGLIEPLLGDAIALDTPAADDAWTAASLRGRYYKRSGELSLADCFLLAAASRREATVATADPGVAAAARSEGLDLIALPDSAGRRP
jgi:PIN domain nuclease of toxin-antitoxin system